MSKKPPENFWVFVSCFFEGLAVIYKDFVLGNGVVTRKSQYLKTYKRYYCYMEKFQELREIAKKRISIADHMLTVTFPFVKDPKLLVTVVENVFLAMTNSMGSVLYYERLFKRVPLFPDNFESKLNLFKDRCIKKYGVNPEHVVLLREIKDIMIQRGKSPVEFSRKDKFVICNGSYRMKTIGVEQLKKYIENAKEFIGANNNIVSKEEGIFAKNERIIT